MEDSKMAARKSQGRAKIALLVTLIVFTFTLAACIAPNAPTVLSSEGEAVEGGEVVGEVSEAGEEVSIAVEEADAAALATGEPAEEATADAGDEATATPEGVAAVPAEGETSDEGL